MEHKLTSVKILKNNYKKFKSKSLDENFTLQKLVNNCIALYNSDSDFRLKLSSFNYLTSGSI